MPNNIRFLISPDYLPDHFSHWYLLSSHLQRESGCPLHLELPDSNTEMHTMIADGQTDLVYANAFLAETLIREQGWLPLARPAKQYDEALVAVAATSDYQQLSDLPADVVIKARTNQDIRAIGLSLLTQAGLDTAKIQLQDAESLSLVASALLKNEAQAGFFLADIYHHLSKHTRENLRVLQESNLSCLTHLAVLHPAKADYQSALRQAFCDMAAKPAAAVILESLDLPDGFIAFTAEEAQQMTASLQPPATQEEAPAAMTTESTTEETPATS